MTQDSVDFGLEDSQRTLVLFDRLRVGLQAQATLVGEYGNIVSNYQSVKALASLPCVLQINGQTGHFQIALADLPHVMRLTHPCRAA